MLSFSRIHQKILNFSCLNNRYLFFCTQKSTDTPKTQTNDLFCLPFFKKTQRLIKILQTIEKTNLLENMELPKKGSSNEISDLIQNKIAYERKFLEILQNSDQEKIGKMLKILHLKKFNQKCLISENSKNMFMKSLEKVLEIKQKEKNDKNLLKLWIKTHFFQFFSRGFKFNRNLTSADFEIFIKSCSQNERVELYLQIVKNKPEPFHAILLKSDIFLNDIVEISRDSSKILKYWRLFFLNINTTTKISKNIQIFMEKITLEEIKIFSGKEIAKLIILLEIFEKDLNKKQEFYYNLKLARKESPLLTPNGLYAINRKINKKTQFFDEELELNVKELLKADPKTWNLKTIQKISVLLNNEYYVFRYYTDFTKKLRSVLIDDEKYVVNSLKNEFRRLEILKALKIRFIKDFFDKILNKYPKLVQNYILLKKGNDAIKLFLGPEHLKIPIISETFQSIEKFKVSKDDLNLKKTIKNAQFKLLISCLLFHKIAFKPENSFVLKTLIEISQNAQSLEPEFKRTLHFFLFNAIPILKSKEINKNLLENCEKIEKSFVFFQTPTQKTHITISKPEKDLMKFFQTIGKDPVKSNFSIGPYSVDFYIESKKIIIEYHGLQHFFLEEKNIKDLMYRDILKKDVLILLGYKYLTISCWVWKKFRTEKDQELFVANLLKNERNFRFNTGMNKKIVNIGKMK